MKGSFRVLLTLCVGLAVAQAVAKVVGLLIILSLVAAIITRPREMIALAVTMGALNLAAAHPLPVLGLIATLAAFRWHSGKALRVVPRTGDHVTGPARITQRKDT